MFRRWIIRGSSIFLLALFVAGWAVSTCRYVACRYGQPSIGLGCDVQYGEVSFSWWRPWDRPRGWHAFFQPLPFHVADSDFFWWYSSGTRGKRTDWRFFCVGLHYQGYTWRPLSGAPADGHTVGIPLWFPILVTALALWWAWKKTRPKLDARTAFPVEIRGGGGA